MDNTEIRERIRSSIGSVRSILDVGCGDGSLVRYLAENVAQEAIGIDTATTGFHLGIGTSGKSPRQAECVKGDAHSIGSFPENRFDAVTCVRAFHELSNPMQALLEMRRVLKVDGILFIADFAKGNEGEKIWGERYYDQREITEFLHRSGFEEISVRRARNEPFLFAMGVKRRG